MIERLRRGIRFETRIGPTAATVTVCRGPEVLWCAARPYAGSERLADELTGLLSDAPRPASGHGLHVNLEPPVAQVRRLCNVPPVRTTALRGLVAQQTGRFFRSSGAEVTTDAMWVGSRGGPTARIVIAAAAESATLVAVAEAASAVGCTVASVCPIGFHRLDLRPASVRTEARAQAERATMRLARLTLALWMVVIAMAVGRLAVERRANQAELASMAAPLEAIRRARDGMDRAAQELAALRQAEHDRGRLARVLLELARALPDSVVAATVEFDLHRSGRLSGLAVDAEEVLAGLLQSGALALPVLEGSTTEERVQGSPWERFVIATDTTQLP